MYPQGEQAEFDLRFADDLTMSASAIKRQLGLRVNSIGGVPSNREVDIQVAEELRRRKVRVEVEKRLATIDEIGEDLYDEAEVLKFVKYFSTNPERGFVYVALKINEAWWLSGDGRFPSQRALSWEQLVSWWVSDIPIESFTVLTKKNEVMFQDRPAPE